jgi:hypothetical protein
MRSVGVQSKTYTCLWTTTQGTESAPTAGSLLLLLKCSLHKNCCCLLLFHRCCCHLRAVARQPRGLGFIEYEDERDAADAVRGLDHSKIDGYEVGQALLAAAWC